MGKLFDGKLVFTQIPLLLKYLPVTMEPGCHSNDRQSHPGTAPCTCED